MTLVNDGDRVWIDTAQSGVIQHESQTIKPTGAELLDPAPLIPAFELRRAAETTVAGRGAFVVEASPRVAHAPPVDLVPHGSDEITLAVDAERGVVLRLEARFGGAPVRLLEVTEIAFDEVLPEETFRFAPPPGEEVRTAAEAYPTRNVTLEQAAREASFRVWSPSRLPGRWRAHVLHRPEMRRPRVPESVTILFTDDESLHHFGLEQAGEPVLAWRTGEEKLIDRNGLELRVIGGNVLPGPPLEVHVARDRTHIRVYSDNLDEDALIQIAASLTPAPTEQPPVSE